MIKALVVEDERMIREGITTQVDWAGLNIDQIRSAENGEEALEIAKDYMPDIVISDIRMRSINGVQLCTTMKQHCPNLKIIFISGYSDKEYLMSAIDLQAVKYIEKPVSLEELEEALRSAVNSISKDDMEKAGKFHNMLRNQEETATNSREYAFVAAVFHKPDVINDNKAITDFLKGYFTPDLRESVDFMINFMENSDMAVLFCSDNKETLSRLMEDDSLWNGMMHQCSTNICITIGSILQGDQNIRTSFDQAIELKKQIEYKGWGEIYRYSQKEEQTDNFICNEIKKYIAANYSDKNLSLQSIADSVFMSVPYISTLFKKVTGSNIGQYVQNYRMDKAKELLMDPQYKIYQVADMVGYEDAHYFAKLFRKQMGFKPTEYRNSN